MSLLMILGLSLIGIIGLAIGIAKRIKLVTAISAILLLLPLSQIAILFFMAIH